MAGFYVSSKNHILAAVAAIVIAGTIRSTDASSKSFYYDQNAECSYPFDDFTVTTLSCVGSSYTYVNGYNDVDASDVYDESICSFGDTLNVQGTTTLIGAAGKKFSLVLNVCYGGSDNPYYNPQTCTRNRASLDLTDYARLADAEYYNQELDETDYYLQPGTYQWRAAFTIPKKTFYFSTGTFFFVW
jgi:hypothetical protein